MSIDVLLLTTDQDPEAVLPALALLPHAVRPLRPEVSALLEADKDVKAVLSRARLANLFDLGYHLKHVDTIFRRVFGTTRMRVARR